MTTTALNQTHLSEASEAALDAMKWAQRHDDTATERAARTIWDELGRLELGPDRGVARLVIQRFRDNHKTESDPKARDLYGEFADRLQQITEMEDAR